MEKDSLDPWDNVAGRKKRNWLVTSAINLTRTDKADILYRGRSKARGLKLPVKSSDKSRCLFAEEIPVSSFVSPFLSWY